MNICERCKDQGRQRSFCELYSKYNKESECPVYRDIRAEILQGKTLGTDCPYYKERNICALTGDDCDVFRNKMPKCGLRGDL